VLRPFAAGKTVAMPPEHYNFTPNPEEMNFGQLMAHIVQGNSATSAAFPG
jgi:hypothetical protein